MTVMDAVASGVPQDSKHVHSNEVLLEALLPMLFTAINCFFLQYHPKCIECLEQDAPRTPTIENAIMKVDLDAGGAACLAARHSEWMGIRTEVLALWRFTRAWGNAGDVSFALR